MEFPDLPLEILSEISKFSHIVMPYHLASLCMSLVNNTFRTFGVRELYKRVSICYRQKESPKACFILASLNSISSRLSQALTLFFNTLSRYPHLALLVYRIGKLINNSDFVSLKVVQC